ncbi:MAG TPA: FG-GAP-like repeat-containing protein [Streptomyces sp.]|nr:FG-GAP-like repeat-containing protein [Streptomyces sp.]
MHQQHRLRPVLATATAAALTGALLTFTAATATAADSAHVPQADFNGDGVGDIAFSSQGAYVGSEKRAGRLVVLYGTGTGVSSAQRSVISQDTTGTPGTAEADDGFGYDNAYGDFNSDGYDDIAVAASGEDVDGDTDGGTVAILWGSASGITGKGTTITDPARSSHDFWGKNLAAGDFDGDGKDDLAVGASSATVHVFEGGATTSGGFGGRYTLQPPIMGSDADGPLNLTSGDVNDDGRTDLLVNGYETQTQYGWNRNYYVPGTESGLSTASLRELKPGVISGIADINGDGFGDVVSGAAWNAELEDGTTVPDAAKGGKVWVTYGSVSGPASATGITQDTGNVPGTSEANDSFGYELDLGDVNGDGYQDLAIGVAHENLDGVTDAGAVTILYGSASGLNTTSGAQFFAQSSTGVPGSDETGDRFGLDVKLDDINGDGRADLLVGSAENEGNGSVVQLPSNGTKITTAGAATISPSTSGVPTTGTPYFGSNFAD